MFHEGHLMSKMYNLETVSDKSMKPVVYSLKNAVRIWNKNLKILVTYCFDGWRCREHYPSLWRMQSRIGHLRSRRWSVTISLWWKKFQKWWLNHSLTAARKSFLTRFQVVKGPNWKIICDQLKEFSKGLSNIVVTFVRNVYPSIISWHLLMHGYGLHCLSRISFTAHC